MRPAATMFPMVTRLTADYDDSLKTTTCGGLPLVTGSAGKSVLIFARLSPDVSGRDAFGVFAYQPDPELSVTLHWVATSGQPPPPFTRLKLCPHVATSRPAAPAFSSPWNTSSNLSSGFDAAAWPETVVADGNLNDLIRDVDELRQGTASSRATTLPTSAGPSSARRSRLQRN